MDNEENKLYNEIDMETDIVDDDDSFGIVNIRESKSTITEQNNTISESSDRDYVKNTGVMIDLRDDDDVEIKDLKPLTVGSIYDENLNIEQQIMNAKNRLLNSDQIQNRNDFSGINEIDMECSVGEDDDFYDNPSFDSTLETLDEDKELIDESPSFKQMTSSDKFIDQGDVEKDYYEKLKKKHLKTNVKGAGYHIHLAGNPQAEIDMFNHENTRGAVANASVASAATAGDGVTGSFGVSFGENKESSPYKKLFEDLLLITGFKCTKNDDGTYNLHDECSSNQDVVCKDNNEIFNQLKPYIDDCFIFPLQIETKETFDTCKDWVDWYTNENAEKYPSIKSDIAYCDLVANHINDFTI